MGEEKNVVILDNYEQNITVRALNDLRNKLISENRSTDAVDEIIIKTINAKKKRMRVCEEIGYETR